MVFTKFTSGVNTSFSSELNENNYLVGNQLLGSDVTSSSVSSSTYAAIHTISIGAGEVNDHIWITTHTNAFAGTGQTADTNIVIDSTQIFARRIVSISGATMTGYATMTYYYEPTSDEKTNGFDVIIQGKHSNATAVTAEATFVLGR